MQSALPPLPPKRSSGGRADIYFREVGFGTIRGLLVASALWRWAGYGAGVAGATTVCWGEVVDGAEDPKRAAAWVAELDRRVRELDSGTAKAVPWEQAKAESLARLRSKRSQRLSRLPPGRSSQRRQNGTSPTLTTYFASAPAVCAASDRGTMRPCRRCSLWRDLGSSSSAMKEPNHPTSMLNVEMATRSSGLNRSSWLTR